MVSSPFEDGMTVVLYAKLLHGSSTQSCRIVALDSCFLLSTSQYAQVCRSVQISSQAVRKNMLVVLDSLCVAGCPKSVEDLLVAVTPMAMCYRKEESQEFLLAFDSFRNEAQTYKVTVQYYNLLFSCQ